MRPGLGKTRARLAAYWGCTAVHVAAVALDAGMLKTASKLPLMPLLASWARSQQAPPLLTGALVASAAGDALLEHEKLLLPGMASFAAAHACYLRLFLSRSANRSWREAAAYALAWATLVTALRPRDRSLQTPAAAYALLLAATGVSSAWSGRRTGLGGAAFVVSDALIAARMAGHEFPGRAPLVMATYTLAQYLLTSGALD
jgi:uncharacterized membrane protein YhhN